MQTFWRTAISVAIVVVIIGINYIIFESGTFRIVLNSLCLFIVLLYNQLRPPEKK
ncbi:hypothetical protein SAMN02787081_01615 [Lysinibacillus fusiformis]|uniref:Uncharacterized protein n=1 Tax=Lysinibacillus fusiformis TaxID=28031 RepID=A0A1H9FFA9_9BACI|nr:hypothetical protein LFU01_28300 [Lysinibacillus fusiformis]SCY21632.1 hypothetical protein SAMN02787081_01615 [Lysinibacillus fusiformis]SEN43654.1 hypothetical protein SAMN02787103_01871 [Lysinibacillus fusiformis]SEQ36569.1 hypothetical protein SAMN02787113_01592 [Lysinibacillus fusiformis]